MSGSHEFPSDTRRLVSPNDAHESQNVDPLNDSSGRFSDSGVSTSSRIHTVLSLPRFSVSSSDYIPSFRLHSRHDLVIFHDDIRRYATVLILFAINLVNYMDRFTIAGVLDDVQKYFGIGEAEAGLLQTVFVVVFMMFAPLFGYLGDRMSRKHIMVFGLIVWSAAVFASSFVPADAFWLFASLRGIVGIGEASYTTVAPTIIADLFTKDARSRMLMIFYFAIPVGSGLGFVIGGDVAQAAGSWQWGIRVTPCLGLVCIALLVLIVREPERGGETANEVTIINPSPIAGDSAAAIEIDTSERSQPEPNQPRSSWLGDIRQILRNRTYLWTTAGFTAVCFVAGSLSWWAPKYILLAEEARFEPDKVKEADVSQLFGIITCLAGIVGVASGSALAQLWRRTNARADPLVCGLGMLVCTPCLFGALVVVEYNIPASYTLIFFAEAASFLNWSVNTDILLYIVIPSRRATATALQILISHLLGDASSPYVIGQVAQLLENSSTSYHDGFVALQRSMFIATLAAVVSALAFMQAAATVVEDKRRAEHGVDGPFHGEVDAVGQQREDGGSGSDSGVGGPGEAGARGLAIL